MPRDRAGATAIVVGVALAGTLLLSGCAVLSSFHGVSGAAAGPSGSPQPDAASSEPAVSPSPVATPSSAAGLDKARFDAVSRDVVARLRHPHGTDFTRALQKAGFPAASMQLTSDVTSIGLTPGSFQFSVLLGDSCLIGQYGPGVGGYRSLATAPLATGGCLVGATVPVR